MNHLKLQIRVRIRGRSVYRLVAPMGPKCGPWDTRQRRSQRLASWVIVRPAINGGGKKRKGAAHHDKRVPSEASCLNRVPGEGAPRRGLEVGYIIPGRAPRKMLARALTGCTLDTATSLLSLFKKPRGSCLVYWASQRRRSNARRALGAMGSQRVTLQCAQAVPFMRGLNSAHYRNAFAKHGCRHLGFRPAHGAPRCKYTKTHAPQLWPLACGSSVNRPRRCQIPASLRGGRSQVGALTKKLPRFPPVN